MQHSLFLAAVFAGAAVATPTPQIAPPSGGVSSYQDIAVFHHNVHRQNHSAPNVAWDAGLASTAAQIASSCYFAHNTTAGGGGYGQNIEAGTPRNNISSIITNAFYNNEEPYFTYYGDPNPVTQPTFGEWGHFTQVVWKSTTKVGCATQDCSAQGGVKNVGSGVGPYFTVCNYSPPGNYQGQFATNVLKPLGEKTVGWDYGLSAAAKSGHLSS